MSSDTRKQAEDYMTTTNTDPTIDPQQLRIAAEEAVAALKLLGNIERLLLLCQLSQGEYSVGELEEQLDIRQPTLSQQLAVLRSAGVVGTRREGKNIYYCVADPNVLDLLLVLYRLYCEKDKIPGSKP
jgi:ArsR family transcriptional regulator